jgi:hypothetical protein
LYTTIYRFARTFFASGLETGTPKNWLLRPRGSGAGSAAGKAAVREKRSARLARKEVRRAIVVEAQKSRQKIKDR